MFELQYEIRTVRKAESISIQYIKYRKCCNKFVQYENEAIFSYCERSEIIKIRTVRNILIEQS